MNNDNLQIRRIVIDTYHENVAYLIIVVDCLGLIEQLERFAAMPQSISRH